MNNHRKLTCHCAKVEIDVYFRTGRLQNIRHCNCSLCKRKVAVIAAVPVEDLTIIKGNEYLSCYQWNTMTAEHYFCKNCGIYTHHKRRSNPSQYGINIACIDGVDPFAFDTVPIGNGDLSAELP